MRRLAILSLLLLSATALAGAAGGEQQPVVAQATGDDWISVTDGAGRVVLERLLHKGDQVALPEGPGFVFTAGNAAATRLIVDGVTAPPLVGGIDNVVHGQPLDPALIAAGRLPAQIAAARGAPARRPAEANGATARPAAADGVVAEAVGAATAVAAVPAPATLVPVPAVLAEPAPDPAPLAPVGAAPAAPAPRPAAAAEVPTDGAIQKETAAAKARIVVAASGDDWISVSDEAGRIVLSRLLHKGERLALPEGRGLVFTAGNAAATRLIVDGVTAPPLGGVGKVVANQPLDPALIAAGRLPAQLAGGRADAAAAPPVAAPAQPAASARLPAYIRRVAMVVPAPAAESTAAPVALSPPGPPAGDAPLTPPRPPAAAAPLAPAQAAAQPVPLMPPLPQAPRYVAPHPAIASAPGSVLLLRSGAGQVVTLGAPAASVFTADPKVADVRPASPTSLFVLGVAPGETTVAALDAAGHPIAQYRVTVTPSAYGADAAGAAIARLVPDAHVTLTPTAGGLAVSGTAPTAADAAEVMALARGYVDPKQTVDDELNVLSEVQVSLQVRVAEMSRSITRELGINWQELGTTGGKITANFMAPSALAFLNTAANSFNFTYHSGNTNIDAFLQALSQDQLARLLAEPNLTAMSGQTASFLVGGEYPIPVQLQNGSVAIQFQPYGVSLSFIPTVLANNRISLRVRPEVSELTNQGAVQLSEGNSTIQIPALLVRRAETTVELGSGQSFAIAGLLQDESTQVDQGLPGLGQLPIIGALFNSNSFQHQETELVIVVTPYIVRPVSGPSAVRLPTDNWTPPNDLERILFFRQQGRGSAASAPAHIPGDAGFIMQ